MNRIEALDLMKEYEERKNQLEVVEEMMESERNVIIGEDALMELERMEGEYGERISSMRADMKVLEMEIKGFVMESGQRVRGRGMQVIYMKPRDKVDVVGLKGYAKAHPEVYDFISKSSPGAQLRKVVGK